MFHPLVLTVIAKWWKCVKSLAVTSAPKLPETVIVDESASQDFNSVMTKYYKRRWTTLFQITYSVVVVAIRCSSIVFKWASSGFIMQPLPFPFWSCPKIGFIVGKSLVLRCQFLVEYIGGLCVMKCAENLWKLFIFQFQDVHLILQTKNCSS